MSSRSSGPVRQPALIALCLMLACVGIGAISAASAEAANYKMVLCAGNNGSGSYETATNTKSAQNPGGIFSFENHCGAAPDPAGNNAFLRIAENQSGGNAGVTAFGSISWNLPPWVAILAGGGYTREPNAFNDGWRGRFWAEGWDGSTNNILMQGTGAANSGINWSPTSTFASHLWPFGGYGDYRRFVFELTCFRQAGCDRANFNAVDANTIVLTLADRQNSQVSFTNGSALMQGSWVRGAQTVTWNASDNGSGLRWERLRVNGAERFVIDHRPACDLGSSGANGEFARQFAPCPTGGPYPHAYTLDTATVPDGARTIQVCAQDYAQAYGLNATGSDTCDQRTVKVDNTAPGAPSGLRVTSANPNRYLDRFAAVFSLPPNEGSPITQVHYTITDMAGKVIVPEKVLTGTNPTELAKVEGPEAPGAYQLRLWLEDAVGLRGPAVTAAIPRDTTPPAAPQDVSVTTPGTPRASQGFDVRWRDITDEGAPIDAAHYEILGPDGKVVVPHMVIRGRVPEQIENLDTPRERGTYTLLLWLSDAEGNEGAPVKVPLAYNCTRAESGRGITISAALGSDKAKTTIVEEGQGSSLSGAVRRLGGQAANAPVCVFGRVLTDSDREFLGVAMTGSDGEYRFALGAGPSREFTAVYRPDQREVSSSATLLTTVHPTFRLQRKVVRNKSFARFSGEIPGPHSDNVLVVLQVKSGKGWRVFRRYRTRGGGRFLMRYRFTQTSTPTTYIMRAQVRSTVGYPYEQGNSRALRLRVTP